jgi:hypothetical protein
MQVELEELGELDEERRGERTAVRLDEVQVTRRDAEPLSHLNLAQALAPAEGADLGAEARNFSIWLGHGNVLATPVPFDNINTLTRCH